MHTSKPVELYTLNVCNLLHINYNSMKLFKINMQISSCHMLCPSHNMTSTISNFKLKKERKTEILMRTFFLNFHINLELFFSISARQCYSKPCTHSVPNHGLKKKLYVSYNVGWTAFNKEANHHGLSELEVCFSQRQRY